jgi:hypothetical protein
MPNQVGPFEGYGEKEPERDDRAIDAWSADMVPRHMQLKKAKILAGRGVGEAAEKILKVRDVTNVVLLDSNSKSPSLPKISQRFVFRFRGAVWSL